MNEYYKIKIDNKFWSSKYGYSINNKDTATKFKTIDEIIDTLHDFRDNGMYYESEIKIIKVVESEIDLF